MAVRTEQDKINLARQICEEYAIGDKTIAYYCKATTDDNGSIVYDTFRRWTEGISEIRALYSEAKKRRAKLEEVEETGAAKSGLRRLAEGFEFTEETVTREPQYDKNGKMLKDEDNKPVVRITKIQQTKKFHPPNPFACKFILTNREPERYKESQEVKLGGGVRLDYDKMTPRELAEEAQKQGIQLPADVMAALSAAGIAVTKKKEGPDGSDAGQAEATEPGSGDPADQGDASPAEGGAGVEGGAEHRGGRPVSEKPE